MRGGERQPCRTSAHTVTSTIATRGGARAQKGRKHLFWDRAHAAERPQPLRTCPHSSASAFGSQNPVSHFLIRTAIKHARNPYDTKRPRFQRAIRKCTPSCAFKPSARVTEFPLRLIEPSAIISAHLLTLGNPRESVCRVPGGYSKLAPRVLGGCSRVLERCTGAASESARANVFSEFSGEGNQRLKGP